MKKERLKNVLLILLSAIFSFGLMFAFVELPVLIDSLLSGVMGFPGFDQGAGEMNAYKSDLFIETYHLRLIGYISLATIIILIAIGFKTKKSGFAFLGAFALFIPVFGQFALSMFFLAGLSILRVGWLPFMDISFDILALGDIIYLPYDLLMGLFGLFNWDAHLFLSYLFMGAGLFLFTWGVLVWMQTKFGSRIVATNWIYKFSRHPQYLGWILWSYGLMLFSSTLNNMKKSWSVPSSLPWLLSTMIIIGICLMEELKMSEEGGQSYDDYRSKTPFLFPVPKWINKIFHYPVKLLTSFNYPKNKMDVVKVTSFFTIVLILLSLLRFDFSSSQAVEFSGMNRNSIVIDSLVNVINNSNRRTFGRQFDELVSIGKESVPNLISLAKEGDENVREFAVKALGRLHAKEAVPMLIDFTRGQTHRVISSSIDALGMLATNEAEAHLINMANDNYYSKMRWSIYYALGNLSSSEIDTILIEGLNDPIWYQRKAALHALCSSNPNIAGKYLMICLEDEHAQVRRTALDQILVLKSPETLPVLKNLLNDEDFETRFYAEQAIEMIGNQIK